MFSVLRFPTLLVIVLLVLGTHLAAKDVPSTLDNLKQIVVPTSPQSPRNGEGDIIVLKDGKLLLVYSKWTKGATADDSPAEICSRISTNRGVTWSAETRLIPNDAMNLMSVSLLRLHNGEIMLVYGRRFSNARMRFYARFSSDEAKTWSGDSRVTTLPGYQAINNARVIQLRSGRLVAPAALCRGETWMKDYFFFDLTYYSDDNGRTWSTSNQKLTVPGCSFGADEPAVVELKDGRVMMLIRTDTGRIWRSYSSDAGAKWSPPEPTELSSPSSPAAIQRIPSTGDLLLVWNNAEPSPTNRGVPRSPLTTAVSSDEGKTWQHTKNLEDAADGNYCYTSVTFLDDRVLLSYYERAALKVAVVDLKWIYK